MWVFVVVLSLHRSWAVLVKVWQSPGHRQPQIQEHAGYLQQSGTERKNTSPEPWCLAPAITNSTTRSDSCPTIQVAKKKPVLQMRAVIFIYCLEELHIISVKCKILPFHITLSARLTSIFTSIKWSEFLTRLFKTTSAGSSEHPPELAAKKNTSKSSKLASLFCFVFFKKKKKNT